MSCQRALELIHPYIDRESDLIQTADVERHLEQCEACRLSYRGQITLRSSLQDASFYYRAPADFKRRITSSLQKEVQLTQTANSSEVTSLR